MPLAVLIAGQLSGAGRAAAVALAELETTEARWPGHASMVQTARAAAGAPEMLRVADVRLASAETDCRWHGVALLRALNSPESVARLGAFARLGPWADRQVATEALSYLGAGVVAALLPLLLDEAQPVDNLRAAIQALATIGPPARPALERLVALANGHWSYDVRTAAARAATPIGRKNVTPRAPRCAVSDGGRRFLPVGARAVPRPTDKCTARSGIALTVDGVCIEGFGGGEWGGVLKADGVEVFREWHSNPVRILSHGGHTYLLQEMRHMRSTGEIGELIHDTAGWRVEFVVSLPGAVEAMWLDAEGRLVLHTEDGAQEQACAGGKLVRFVAGERRIEVLE